MNISIVRSAFVVLASVVFTSSAIAQSGDIQCDTIIKTPGQEDTFIQESVSSAFSETVVFDHICMVTEEIIDFDPETCMVTYVATTAWCDPFPNTRCYPTKCASRVGETRRAVDPACGN